MGGEEYDAAEIDWQYFGLLFNTVQKNVIHLFLIMTFVNVD